MLLGLYFTPSNTYTITYLSYEFAAVKIKSVCTTIFHRTKFKVRKSEVLEGGREKPAITERGEDMTLFKYGDNSTHFQTVFPGRHL